RYLFKKLYLHFIVFNSCALYINNWFYCLLILHNHINRLFHRSHSYPIKIGITRIMFLLYTTTKQSYLCAYPMSWFSGKSCIYFLKIFSIQAITKMTDRPFFYSYSKLDNIILYLPQILYLFSITINCSFASRKTQAKFTLFIGQRQISIIFSHDHKPNFISIIAGMKF